MRNDKQLNLDFWMDFCFIVFIDIEKVCLILYFDIVRDFLNFIQKVEVWFNK